MIILMFWKLSFCFIDLNCSWFFSERTVSRPSCLWFPKTVHSLLNVEFLPKILKTIQAVDMRPHSSLNNRTRNFSCDSATLILGADNAAGQATYCRKTSGFPKHSKCTPYSPLLSPCIHHYYPLPFTPSSPSSSCSWHSFFWSRKTCPSTDRCRFVARLWCSNFWNLNDRTSLKKHGDTEKTRVRV